MKKRTLAGVAAAAGAISAIGLPATPASADHGEGTVRVTGIQCGKGQYCTAHVEAMGYTGTPKVNIQWYRGGSPVKAQDFVAEADGHTHVLVASTPYVGDPGDRWRACAWFDGHEEPPLTSCPDDIIKVK